ncbi:MAG TPA: DUF2156 domain-containing protein [Kofleriaceae bacterium]|nr:DUF2156 domain-containing protein [Kofleriaceae bacterium]
MDDHRQRALALVRRFGDGTTSFQILEPGLAYWFDRDPATGEDLACVAYSDTGGAWVAAGEPVAPSDHIAEVMSAFAAAARANHRRARFFAAERRPPPDSAFAALAIGAQPLWDPAEWLETLRKKRSLREQLRRARAKGVVIRQVESEVLADPASPTRLAVDAMLGRWLDSRSMAPMGFLVTLDPYNLPEERRFLVAERDGKVVGILVAVPIYARGGWFFEDVLRDPAAPNGTIELLFDHAMRRAAAEGSRRVTFGLAPLAQIDSRVLEVIRGCTRWLYDFEGLRAFKAKLMPRAWQPIYLVYPRTERGVRAVLDSLKAFAHRSFIKFAARTLVHRAPAVVRLLAILLIPWTVLLALAPTRAWFPDATVQSAWMAADAVLFFGLIHLARRWRRALANTIAAAAAGDFVLGAFQAALYNIPRAKGPWTWAIMVAALIAPAFASAFIYLCRNRAPSHFTKQ